MIHVPSANRKGRPATQWLALPYGVLVIAMCALTTASFNPRLFLESFGLTVNDTTLHITQMVSATAPSGLCTLLSLLALASDTSPSSDMSASTAAVLFGRLNFALVYSSTLAATGFAWFRPDLSNAPVRIAGTFVLLAGATGALALAKGSSGVLPNLAAYSKAALLPPTGHASSAQGTATYLSALTMEGYVIGSVLPFVADIILGSCLPGLLPTPGGRALAWCLGTMLVPAAAAFNAVRAVVDAGGAECKACRALSMGAAATLALQVGFLSRSLLTGVLSTHWLSIVFVAALAAMSGVGLVVGVRGVQGREEKVE